MTEHHLGMIQQRNDMSCILTCCSLVHHFHDSHFQSAGIYACQLVTLCTEASLLKPRDEGLGQRDAKAELDSLYALLEQPWMTSNESSSDATKTEKKFVTFEGIGPTDEQTGVPLATRIVSTQHTAVDALSTKSLKFSTA